MPKPTDEQIQMAALSSAICNVMAVVFAEVEAFKQVLSQKGHVTLAEFEAAKLTFPQERFQGIADELNKRILEKAKEKAKQMKAGRVVH